MNIEYYKNSKGEMFFGGKTGFIYFHPSEIQDNPHVPPIVLTAFKKLGKSVDLERSLTFLQEIELSYQDVFIEFEFAALDYTAPDKNQYTYRLEGITSNWINIDNRRHFSFTNLNPGHYMLQVKGSNNDGVWNEEELRIRLIVAPPPWLTWWAYSLYTLALAGVVWAYVHWRT